MALTKENRKLLKEQLNLLDKVLKDTHLLVQEEREKGPEMMKELELQLEQAISKHEKLEKKIKRAKTQIKKRKKEIDEWKQWYNGLVNDDKTDELKQLEDEIKWRAAEIAAKEQDIAQLVPKEIDAEGVREQIQIRIQAFREVDHNTAIEEDPRLVDIQEERSQIMKQLTEVVA